MAQSNPGNYTADTIYRLLNEKISDGKITLVKDKFPTLKNSVEYARIVVKSDARKSTLELVDDVLKDLNIPFREGIIRGSSFKAIIIDNYYKIGKKEKGIRIFFKYNNGRDFINNDKLWNNLLKEVFRNHPNLKRTPRDRTEVRVLMTINEQIQTLGKDLPVTLRIGRKSYDNVAGFVGGMGTRKADFVIVDYAGNEIGFLSYKAGNTATDFQQYGGITERAGTDIVNNSEVEGFKELVVDNWETYKTGYASIWREIQDNNLKKQSVFGKDFSPSRSAGHDNVDFLVQGTPNFTSNGKIIFLRFTSKTVRKGNLTPLQGDYEPVLGARGGERSRRITIKGRSIYGVRGGIWARGYITKRSHMEI
jgi:hypothetical protein